MKICILLGSPKLHGNTAELLKPFVDELEKHHVEVDYITLTDKEIAPCKGCYACQHVSGEYGCVQKDAMQDIMDRIVQSDCFVLATPIYSWYCPAKMKAMLDRHYGMNKFYGKASGSLWAGKKCAIIATHGYEASYATEPFETGIKRLCVHSKLNYLGMYSVRHMEDKSSFQTAEAMEGARSFARNLIKQ